MISVLSNIVMTVTIRKQVMIIFFFHLRHKININKQLDTSKIHSNVSVLDEMKYGFIPPINIAAIPVYIDLSMGATYTSFMWRI